MNPMEYAVKAMESAARNYRKDLEAMTEEQVVGSVGGGARRVVDFTYEVALLNRDAAARIMGIEQPVTPEGEEWWVAPAELQSKQAIYDFMVECCSELIDAAKANIETWDKNIGLEGKIRPAYDLVNFSMMHTMYHCAQLNYIQSLASDMKMHWF
jgi:hypothetical protein